MPHPPENKRGLFAPPSPPPPPQPAEQANVTSRVRFAEEKVTNINHKIEILESNFVSFTRKTKDDLRAMDADILDMKRELENIKQKIELIIRELKLSAGKDELNAVTRYLDMWNLTRFASRDEVERIVEEKINNILKKIE